MGRADALIDNALKAKLCPLVGWSPIPHAFGEDDAGVAELVVFSIQFSAC
jgi:hypothetical protein